MNRSTANKTNADKKNLYKNAVDICNIFIGTKHLVIKK